MSVQQIPIPERLVRLVNPKRFKILIGGRGSAKSETVAALFAAMVNQSGCTAVCCREFQTSIKQSVHALMWRKIGELELGEFNKKETEITHSNGGLIMYQGLARDPEAIKSIDNAELCWVEEAQSLSHESLEKLTPSIRAPGSEIWFTANLGSSMDPFSQKFIKPFEKQLRRDGYYEDELHTIIWINYYDNPWFPKELEQERLRDKQVLDEAEYDHKWLGEFSDTVENALIKPAWFDACIDAHKVLGFQPMGVEVIAHDPSDDGSDSKGLAYRHGVVFIDVQDNAAGDINAGADWAAEYAQDIKPDVFIWDGDGMGAGLKRQFQQALGDKNITLDIFRGAATPDNPEEFFVADADHKKRNRETFRNKRAQYYWDLRERCFRTYQAVQNRLYTDPDELISFSSEIKRLDQLRSEICTVPLKPNAVGMIQVLSKAEMRSKGIPSPNMADAVMMSLSGKNIRAMTSTAPRIRHVRMASPAGY